MAVSVDSADRLTEYERYFFDLYGYIVRREALDGDRVAELNRAIDRMGLPQASASVPSQRFTGFLEREQIFRDLIDQPAAIGALVDLCGSNVRLDHAYGIQMRAGTSGLSLHGGGVPHDPSQFYRVVDGHQYNGLVAVSWALVDHPSGAGGFCCIPGSHRANFGRPAEVPDSWVVDIVLAAGDMVIFTEALTHGTSPWNGTHDRRALLYKYSPGHMAWSGHYETTIAAANQGELSDRQRAVLRRPGVSQPDRSD